MDVVVPSVEVNLKVILVTRDAAWRVWKGGWSCCLGASVPKWDDGEARWV